MPAKQRFRLDDESRVFPGESDEPGASARHDPTQALGTLDLSLEDEALLAQHPVFNEQVRLAARQVFDCADDRGSITRLTEARSLLRSIVLQ